MGLLVAETPKMVPHAPVRERRVAMVAQQPALVATPVTAVGRELSPLVWRHSWEAWPAVAHPPLLVPLHQVCRPARWRLAAAPARERPEARQQALRMKHCGAQSATRWCRWVRCKAR